MIIDGYTNCFDTTETMRPVHFCGLDIGPIENVIVHIPASDECGTAGIGGVLDSLPVSDDEWDRIAQEPYG